MSSAATDLSPAACLEHHRRSGSSSSLAALSSVDSTNGLARRVAEHYLAGRRPVPRLIAVARTQTDGRGRRGRSWSSPVGGIYASLLLSLADAAALAALPLRVPLELCRALERRGAACAIKWPNDLVVDGRKLGGILIEALAGPLAVVVGFGVNGNQAEADRPRPGATSLRRVTGLAVDLSALAVDLAVGLLERLGESHSMAATIEAYRRRSAHRPGDELAVRIDGERLRGRFAGFDARGRLRLDTEDGPRLLSSADSVEGDVAKKAAGSP